MEPFYFKSYDKVVGVARDLNELERELARLSREDPGCVEYHLKEGHVVAWLNYIGERGLAEILKGVSSPREALSRISEFRAIPRRETRSRKQKTRRANI
ncbi:hypothetical protein L3N51_01295 [Metallosphaera sp. J1]|uniref:hypothetical protein n=1 Tax=Metallosphaera javensis (ex Hofmann et al. 2022) TaxID=99938 RepID=UPI001EE02BFC|nr:hypothetical protein [Metallosphaera javensis (ex Hofmann et al. 2022)]MCG3109005.1 hypothetical protein [Metallosphaera javensis (ex Hofmann et al. 2022)]